MLPDLAGQLLQLRVRYRLRLAVAYGHADKRQDAGYDGNDYASLPRDAQLEIAPELRQQRVLVHLGDCRYECLAHAQLDASFKQSSILSEFVIYAITMQAKQRREHYE